MNKRKNQHLLARYKQLYVKGWDELLVKLRAHGGEMLVPKPEPKEQVKMLLKNGRLFDSSKLKIQKGEPKKCHTNAARLWANDEQLQLVTGYALSNTLWRQHSWAWNATTGELIETITRRKKYFGVVFNDMQASKFAFENVPEFDDPAKCPPRLEKCVTKTMKLLARIGLVKFTRILLGYDDPEKYLIQEP